VLVDLYVPVEDLVQGLFGADFKDIVIFSQEVDDSDLPGLLGETAYAARLIGPPGSFEINRPVSVRLHGRDVEVPSSRAVVPHQVSLSADSFLGLVSLLVEPVSDILPRSPDDRLCQLGEVFLNQIS
jgi:hypothetical protein